MCEVLPAPALGKAAEACLVSDGDLSGVFSNKVESRDVRSPGVIGDSTLHS